MAGAAPSSSCAGGARPCVRANATRKSARLSRAFAGHGVRSSETLQLAMSTEPSSATNDDSAVKDHDVSGVDAIDAGSPHFPAEPVGALA